MVVDLAGQCICHFTMLVELMNEVITFQIEHRAVAVLHKVPLKSFIDIICL